MNRGHRDEKICTMGLTTHSGCCYSNPMNKITAIAVPTPRPLPPGNVVCARLTGMGDG